MLIKTYEELIEYIQRLKYIKDGNKKRRNIKRNIQI